MVATSNYNHCQLTSFFGLVHNVDEVICGYVLLDVIITANCVFMCVHWHPYPSHFSPSPTHPSIGTIVSIMILEIHWNMTLHKSITNKLTLATQRYWSHRDTEHSYAAMHLYARTIIWILVLVQNELVFTQTVICIYIISYYVCISYQ